MHEVVRDELERHLAGKASPVFYAHLEACASCRVEVDGMDEVSRILRDLTPALGDVPSPSLGFYSRVTSTIREQQPRSPLAGLFSPGKLFFRRVAFASILLLTGLGTLLVSNEAAIDGVDATAIMAEYDSSISHAASGERDSLLVTLAAYHE